MDGNSSSWSANLHPGDWKGWPLWDRCLCWDHTVCTWKVDWWEFNISTTAFFCFLTFLLQVWYWKWLRARMMVLSKANPIFLAPKTTACSSVQLRSRWQLHAAEIISFWSQVCDSKQNSPGRSSKTPSRFDFISRNSCSPVSLRKYLVFFFIYALSIIPI